MSDTTTFLNFIQNHTIQIPLIQRDYVQGLALTEKAKEKRDEFVRKLLDALLPNGKPYTLDFIYGARESFDSNINNPDAPFLPLDGQQRLTTLYLLHWVLSVKTNNENVLEALKRFSYKTRISSDKFCRRLLGSTFDAKKPLYDQIKDKTWYVSLEKDPTVMAIMEMIKQIENTLKVEPYKEKLEELACNLLNDGAKRITFSILDMERYHLTDGLYIKMNARGKELTPFENWKADFINLISSNEFQKDRFTNSIEHEWNDLFWRDVYKNYVTEVSKILDEKNKRKVKYPRIDEHFMNFFNNFSRLYFFVVSTSDNPKAEDYNEKLWSTTKALYGGNKGLAIKLFNLLDALVKIDADEGIYSFFNNLFYISPSTDWNQHTISDDNLTKVKLFDCDNVDLFKSCFEGDNFGWQHVMLYAILKYCVKHDVYKVTEELKTYVRVCRNYLYQHNYLDAGKLAIVAQVRVVDMKTYDKVFNYLCSEQSPIESLKNNYTGEDSKYVEIERNKLKYYNTKADIRKLVHKIEDLSYCYGDIQAFDEILNKCLNKELSCEIVWNAVYSFKCATDLQKAQLFVALNYKGMTIGNDCAYGKRIFIGGKGRWAVHFRKNEHEIGNWISAYVDAYTNIQDVVEIVESEKRKIVRAPQNMRDYMLKYEQVLAAQVWWRNDTNEAPFYYAMPNPWNDMDAIVIHSFSSRPLGNSYQTCPMANAVARTMSNFDAKYMGFTGHGSNKEGIYIHNSDSSKLLFSMKFMQSDWCVTLDSYKQLPPHLQSRFTPHIEDGSIIYYQLQSRIDKDLIENAIDFIKEVVENFKENKYI